MRGQCTLLMAFFSVLSLAALAAEPRAVRIVPGRETTFFDGPLDKSGEVDFEKALNERLRGRITPEQNVNVLLVQALGPARLKVDGMDPRYFEKLGIPDLSESGDSLMRFDQFNPADARIRALKPKDESFEQLMERPWKAADSPYYAAWLKANERPFGLVAEAVRREQYFNPLLLSEDLSACNTTGARSIARELMARAMLRLGERLPDEAWDDVITGHRLGRSLSFGGSWEELLAGIAIDAVFYRVDGVYLENCRLSARQLRKRLRELQALPPIGSVANQIDLGDRVTVLRKLQLLRQGNAEFLDGEFEKPSVPLTAEQKQKLLTLDWSEVQRATNRWHDRTVAALRIEDRAMRQRALLSLQEEIDLLKGPPLSYTTLEKFLFDAVPGQTAARALSNRTLQVFNKVTETAMMLQRPHDITVQRMRTLQIAYAIAIYRREYGRFPAKLNDLAPDILGEVPNDLFTDKPLAYRAQGEGFLLYSFGSNGKDDGGRKGSDLPRGDDIPFQIVKLLPGPSR